MLDFNLFTDLYDFSVAEKAVQDFFVELPTGSFVKPPNEDELNRESWTPPGGAIPFYTPTQALVLQSCRPRVGIVETNFTEMTSARVLDAEGTFRASAWNAVLRLAIVTECNYARHRALRASVLAIIPQLQPNPTGNISNTGVNAYLANHEIGKLAIVNADTSITPAEGYYLSTVTINLTLSVRPTAWPGGLYTG
jgi:hypothetical protein